MCGRETTMISEEIRGNMITESMLTEREITGSTITEREITRSTITEKIIIRERKRGERTARDGRAPEGKILRM